MLITTKLSPKTSQPLTKNASPVVQPRTQEWTLGGDTFTSTDTFVQEIPHRLTLASPSKGATFTFTDNELKPAISTGKKVAGALESGFGGALVGGFAGMALSVISAGIGGAHGISPSLYHAVAGIGLVIGAAVGATESWKSDSQPRHISKEIQGTVSAGPEGTFQFQPLKSQAAVNLNEYQSAITPQKGEDGQYKFGEQWWNNLAQ